MPRRRTHSRVGTVAGVGTTMLASAPLPDRDRWPEILGGGIAGWVFGLLPDVLEPAHTPHHRGVAHSMLAAWGITRLNWRATVVALRAEADWLRAQADSGLYGPIDRDRLHQQAWWKHLLAGFIMGAMAGYASHLLLDAATPSSLPLFGLR